MSERTPMPRCIILGGGGHASVIIEGLLLAQSAEPIAVLDQDSRLWGTRVLEVPVVGDDARLPEFARTADCFAVGVGSIGNNHPRARLFAAGCAAGLAPATLIHPTAIVSPSARIGPGSQLLAGCIVGTNAVLGENVIVNTGAIIDHDCAIGDHAHIAPGACLGGGVRVGQRAHVGAGSCVRQGLSVGEDALVGAGAVVVKDVPLGITVAGVPAVPLRKTVVKTPAH